MNKTERMFQLRKICPHCGWKRPVDSMVRFCNKCGWLLVERLIEVKSEELK